MAEVAITKTVVIILVIVVLVILLVGGRALLLKATNATLSYLGIADYGEPDYSVINANAIATFNTLIRDINKCLKSEDKNCACEASFAGFFETHRLESDGNELRLINIKGGNEITMKKEEVKGLNCYLDNKNIKQLDKLKVSFNKDLPYIPVSGSDPEFDKIFKLYKNDEICWFTSKADITSGIKTCS